MAKRIISIGCDHAGYELKEDIKSQEKFEDIEWKDFGAFSDESVDYPDFSHPTAQAVEDGVAELGVIICGSGNGIAMAANKHQGIRAAVCWNEDISRLARQHNDANMIALPSRYIDRDLAIKLVEIFLETKFDGGRHDRRVKKIPC
jgi:ribose 5-phosphate isomerase B